MELAEGSKVGVIGGGPAGALASYFLLDMAERVGLKLKVDIYEPRDFSRVGPAGCNMCGGVVSESLVQVLATEGINLPPTVVQRGIDSYVLHTDRGTVRIQTPLHEMRIACVHRGSGPRGSQPGRWHSFDDFLLKLACDKGANHIAERVKEVGWEDGRPVIRAKQGPGQRYDLAIGAVGVNSWGSKLFRNMSNGFREPQRTKTWISEIFIGSEEVQQSLGNSFHVFLLDIPRLDFAAIIPKGDYATVCVLGRDIDQELCARFMSSPEVRGCLPVECGPTTSACRCGPRINVVGARRCFGDRIVLVGDCAVSRLYKDGIGAAYRAAKACAVTAIFHGISEQDFERHYWPTCRRLERDNRIGKLLFAGGSLCRKLGFLRRGMLRMAQKEQGSQGTSPDMSMVLWDMFTGSAPYRDILLRTASPVFLIRYLWHTFGLVRRDKQ